MTIIFSLLSFIPHACNDERSQGTVLFTLRFFILNTFINTLSCGIALLLHFVGVDIFMRSQENGLWSILFCNLLIECYMYPEMPRGLCCCPVTIKSKYYPVVLFLIFTLLLGGLDIFMLMGLMVGYMWVFG